MDIITAILGRPFLEIAGIVGLLILVIVALGFAVYLIFRGLSYLHIKKIGVTGIECETEPHAKRKRRKPCASQN